MENKRLTRSSHNRIISGVAAGIAEYLDIDPVIVRIIFVFLLFFGGGGLLLYLILLFIMPDDRQPLNEKKSESHSGDFVVDDKGNVGTATEYVEKDKDIPETEKAAVEEEPSTHSDKKKNNVVAGTIIGILLIGVGVVILFSKLFSFCWTQYFFPVLLVVTGIILMAFSVKPKKN